MNTLTVALQLLVIAGSLLAATVASFRPLRLAPFAPAFYPRGAKRVGQAALHWVGTIATAASVAVPILAFFASCIVFVSAIPLAVRTVRAKLARSWMFPAFLLAAPVVIALSQPLGLKVMLLPKADDLPYVPSPAKVVKTYDEGLWFEGIAAAGDGTLYLSGNRGLDFSRGDYYRDARGELIARQPDGSERVIFRTPKGLTSGVPVIAADRSIYLTSHGAVPRIWHIVPGGAAVELARLPQGAWPNGLDIGPDGMLYAPDSALGQVWRIDPRSGKAEVALRDKLLLARPFISLAPGANGLHFRGRDLLVTVSDRTTVLRYRMDGQGRFGPAKVIATGIPGDDFAIGPDGSLFVATHPYNTVVRVAPDGARTIVGKEAQHIVGATDAAFGRTPQDKDTLYVVTDGGAFTGGPKTRGELVALTPYATR